MEDTKLPKCLMFVGLVRGAGCAEGQEKEWIGLFGCTSRTVSYVRELMSVYIRYSQGDGFNTPLSRLPPDSVLL